MADTEPSKRTKKNLQEFVFDVLSPDQIAEFHTKGFLVVDQVLSPPECQDLGRAMVEGLNLSVFGLSDEPHRVQHGDAASFGVLTDPALRQKHLRDPNCIFTNGNTRAPKLAKSSGMLNLFFLPEALHLVVGNRTIYNIYRQLMGTDEFLWNPERVGIKAPGATDMPLHMDIDMIGGPAARPSTTGVFGSEDWQVIHGSPRNFRERIQGFLTVDVDETVDPRDSGTLQLIPHFSLYWDLLREVLHPDTGLAGVRFAAPVTLPLMLDEKAFDLATLNRYIALFTRLQEDPEQRAAFTQHAPKTGTLEEHAWKVFSNGRLTVPAQRRELRFAPVPARRGSLVLFDGAPHRNLRNKSKKRARMVAYVDLRPLSLAPSPDYYATAAFRKRKELIQGLDAQFGTGRLRSNHLEREMVKKYFDGDGKYHSKYVEAGNYRRPLPTPLLKALLGIDPATGATYTWQDLRRDQES